MSEPLLGSKEQTIYYTDKGGNNPVKLKGFTYIQDTSSLPEYADKLGYTLDDASAAFSKLSEAFSKFTYEVTYAKVDLELLLSIFGRTKKGAKQEALRKHYIKKALRDATREDPERSKMHTEYRRRQRSRSRRKR